MNKITLTSMALLSALLGACATSTDPREGGFFGGVSGLNTGAYEQRVRDREANLAQLRETQRSLNEETRALESEKSAVYQRVEADRARVRKLNTDIAALDKRVSALGSQQGADQKRVKELQTRLDDLKRKSAQQGSALDALEGSGLGDAEADLRRKQLEQQRAALQREYELLMKMQLELAR